MRRAISAISLFATAVVAVVGDVAEIADFGYGIAPHTGYSGSIGYAPPPPPPKKSPIRKKPCCLTGFTKDTGYGYGAPLKKHDLKPKLDVLLFENMCPLHKDDKTVCEVAAEEYAKYGTTFTVKNDYLPPSPKPGYHNVNPVNRVENPKIVHGLWYSDTDAALVAIGVGCCYNIYGDVKVGDHLEVECENEVIGDSDELYQLLKYSIITPGTAELRCQMDGVPGHGDTCNFPNAAVIGKDLVLEPFQFKFDFEPPSNYVQYWAGISLQVGDDVLPTTGTAGDTLDTLVLGKYEQYVNGLNFERIAATASKSKIDEEDVEDSTLRVETRVCALSDRLKTLAPSKGATIVLQDNIVEIDCRPVQSQDCVLVIEDNGQDQSAVRGIHINAGGVQQIIINTFQEVVRVYLESYILTNTNVNVIWNYNKATVLDIVMETDEVTGYFPAFLGSIVAPRALTLVFEGGEFGGSLLTGDPQVLLEFSGYPILPSDPLPLPSVEPVITLCDCLCGDCNA